ncbi:hypothetical protein [Aestuariivirga sp.]|uniref:hypothetical protein n=1 Tax=Aestuariivirga sp. TaxID=2650926 RepID=UPI0035945BB1
MKPLLYYEREADYDALLASVIMSISPRDSVEFIKAKEVTDCIWEGTRLKRLQHDAVTAELPKAVHDLIGAQFAQTAGNDFNMDGESAKEDVYKRTRMATQKDAVKRPLRDLLKYYNVDEQVVHAMAFKSALPFVEKIVGIRDAVEQRGEKALRSIEQRRLSLAAQTRSLTHGKGGSIIHDVTEVYGNKT